MEVVGGFGVVVVEEVGHQVLAVFLQLLLINRDPVFLHRVEGSEFVLVRFDFEFLHYAVIDGELARVGFVQLVVPHLPLVQWLVSEDWDLLDFEKGWVSNFSLYHRLLFYVRAIFYIDKIG